MRIIPLKIRKEIALDPFMKICIYKRADAPNHDCQGRIEWEHAWIYAGKQILDPWATLPCCTSHNRGKGIVKDYNRFIALLRAKELGVWEELKIKYPKRYWDQEFKYLSSKYV